MACMGMRDALVGGYDGFGTQSGAELPLASSVPPKKGRADETSGAVDGSGGSSSTTEHWGGLR